MPGTDFFDQFKELVALLPAILIILVPLLLHIRSLKRRRSGSIPDHDTEGKLQTQTQEMLQQDKDEKPAQIVEPPVSADIVSYWPVAQTEDWKEEPPMPPLKVGRIPVSGESEVTHYEVNHYTVIRKDIHRKMEAFPPLKRAVIWSEILGPPLGLSLNRERIWD